MTSLLLALSLSTSLAAAEQPRHAAPAIPAAFQGRWASNAYQCMGGADAPSLITITARGWTGVGGSGTVSRIGPVRRGTHNFSVNSVMDGHAMAGTLGLRRVGARLIVIMTGHGGQSIQSDLQHCQY